uniref:Uncharacterized protein n=1 Tax=Pyxicephalus adspersus TaxID=30357 RepID=A0AAV3A6F2_PYXAD|nr:TPA: hypothetical protein GDO54_014110 [Pyxicephalus adspersus]
MLRFLLVLFVNWPQASWNFLGSDTLDQHFVTHDCSTSPSKAIYSVLYTFGCPPLSFVYLGKLLILGQSKSFIYQFGPGVYFPGTLAFPRGYVTN